MLHMDLGATPWQALVKVIVPQIMPGIVSGALIAFTMSFDDFVISYFVTGQGVKNLSIMVYTMSKRINPSVNAISTLVVLLITITLTIVNILPIIRKKTSASKQNKPWKWVAAGVVVVGLVASLFGLNKSPVVDLMQDKLYMYITGVNIQVKISFQVLKS